MIGTSYVKLGRNERAVYPLTRCTEIMPMNEKYFLERGKVYQTLQMFEEAVFDYTKVLELNNSHAKALFRRAFAYKALKQFDLAVTDMTRAKALDPENAHYNINHKYLRGVNYLRTAQSNRTRAKSK